MKLRASRANPYLFKCRVRGIKLTTRSSHNQDMPHTRRMTEEFVVQPRRPRGSVDTEFEQHFSQNTRPQTRQWCRRFIRVNTDWPGKGGLHMAETCPSKEETWKDHWVKIL